MHQMQCVGDWVEYHSGAAEHAGPLADSPSQTFFIAGHLEGLLTLAVNLISALGKNNRFHISLTPARGLLSWSRNFYGCSVEATLQSAQLNFSSGQGWQTLIFLIPSIFELKLNFDS
jgi:hypothetical protein